MTFSPVLFIRKMMLFIDNRLNCLANRNILAVSIMDIVITKI